MREQFSRALAMAALGAAPAVVQAQTAATVAGRVTAEGGAPVAGASVFIPSLNIGSTTREDGTYSFTVPGARATGQTVTISVRRVGYRTASAQIALSGGRITQNFTIITSAVQLGAVVVQGAGLSTTAERLGSVRTAVDTQAIVRANEPNVTTALAAKAPGIVVNQQSGDPGASTKIVIRGLNTIQGTGNPLFVVDGTPINNETINTTGGTSVGGATVAPNRAYDINPDDIASVEVLKSSAAAAIYGARASQGVILITTKKGAAGQTRYGLRSTLTSDQVNRLPALQQSYDQGSGGVTRTVASGACTKLDCRLPSTSWGAAIAAGTPVYDQANAIFDTGHLFDNNLQVSGGNDRTQFFLSGSSSNQNGTIVGNNDYYNRRTARLNATQRISSQLSASGNISYVDTRGGFIQRGSNTSGVTLGAWRTPPTFNNTYYIDSTSGYQRSYRFPRPSSGSAFATRGYDNPYFVINDQQNTSNVGRAFGNANLSYTPLPWLSATYTLGADYTSDERVEGLPWTSTTQPQGQVTRGNYVTYIIDNLINVQASHTLKEGFETRVAVGAELNSQRYQQNQELGTQLIANNLFALTNAVQVIPDQSNGADYRSLIRRESYFAQLQQSLFSDLFTTLTVRNDGFSTFGQNNRRNWFPSAQLAYVFTNAFNAGGALSDGKLRLAYGQTGTEPAVYATSGYFTGGQFFAGTYGDQLFSVQNGQGGLVQATRVPQPNLRPERQNELETGFDVGLFRGLADLSATFYDRVARDVIFDAPLPPSSGFGIQARNAAKIRNRGVELSFNVRPIRTKDVDLSLGFQYAQNRNRVLQVQGSQFVQLPTGGYFSGSLAPVAQVGYALGSFLGQDFARCRYDLGGNNVVGSLDVNAACRTAGAPNGAMYIDTNGFPINDPNPHIIGNPNPLWTGGFRPTVRYKKLTVSGLMDVRIGGVVWNGTKGALYNFGASADENIRSSFACAQSQAVGQGGCTATGGQTYVFGSTYTPGKPVGNSTSYPVFGPGAGKAVYLGQIWFSGGTGPGSGLGSGFGPVSSQFLESGSFGKLREVSLAYTIDGPQVRRYLGLSSIDVRVAGRNLALITNYTGVDPETNLGGAAVGVNGIDYFNTPFTRSFVFTVSLNR
jgi:TonB-linked SusC/RagA family outer membrane protein